MHRRFLLFALTLVVALSVGSSAALAGGGNSASAKACQKGGWQSLQSSTGNTFASQGDCVSYGASGGTLYGPRLTATDGGCQVPGFVGFDLWTISATGFTPNSEGIFEVNGSTVPHLWPLDSSGSRSNFFIPDSGGLTISMTFTDGNGVHASVTFGPSTSCPT